MTKTHMAFNRASEIVNTYINFMGQNVDHFSVNELDIIDFVNAAKLMTAFLYNKSKPDIEKYVTWADTGIAMYSMHFLPDKLYLELKNLDKNDPNYKRQKLHIEVQADQEFQVTYGHIETVTSFVNYLKNVDKRDPQFWHKVYEHLAISCSHDDLDDISYAYQKEEKDLEIKDRQNSILSQESNPSFFKRIFNSIFNK
jgi:hypothetical protein